MISQQQKVVTSLPLPKCHLNIFLHIVIHHFQPETAVLRTTQLVPFTKQSVHIALTQFELKHRE